jgi:PPK2 family polyphosphate:nucleotide phosphotransferase
MAIIIIEGMDFRKRFVVKKKSFRLSDHDPDDTAGFDDEAVAGEQARKNTLKLEKLQNVLYAEHKRAVLIVLQGMDAAGKDGTIKHVMSGVNPQGCQVTSFKQPSQEDLDHDFLWRVHKAAPPRGDIGLFNRSHYEDVLVVRVHNMVPKDVWSDRYRQIRDFEDMLHQNGVVILKFFLNISKAEQEKRFEARQGDPDRNWKSSEADFAERKFWSQYQEAYQDALEKTSRSHAPWYVIPANHKWFRNMAVSQIIVDTIEELHPQYPVLQMAKRPGDKPA